MPEKAKITKRALKDAIHASMGNVAATARRLGYSRVTVYDYINRFDLWGEVQKAREALADLAEAKLVEKIQEGNERLIEFVLRAYRPELYNPKSQAEVGGEVVVRVVYDDEVKR